MGKIRFSSSYKKVFKDIMKNSVTNFYGRKLGRLSLLAKDLLQNLLPTYALLKSDLQSGNFSKITKPFEELNLEVGFGSGDFLWQNAGQYPKNFYLGVEVFQSGIATLLGNLKNKPLSNLKIYPNSLYDILELLPVDSFNNIYVLFPDPWFKARHHKRRIINSNNLQIFAKLLKNGGNLIIASDVVSYITWTLEKLQQDNWHIQHYTNHEIDNNPNNNFKIQLQTRYEQKAIQAGRTVTYIYAKKFSNKINS